MSVVAASPSDGMQRMEANLHGHIAWVQRAHGSMVVRDEPAFLLVDSGRSSDTFNNVARARLAPETVRAGIACAAGYFQRAGRPFAWWLASGLGGSRRGTGGRRGASGAPGLSGREGDLRASRPSILLFLCRIRTTCDDGDLWHGALRASLA